jgi:hypothetical protein
MSLILHECVQVAHLYKVFVFQKKENFPQEGSSKWKAEVRPCFAVLSSEHYLTWQFCFFYFHVDIACMQSGGEFLLNHLCGASLEYMHV